MCCGLILNDDLLFFSTRLMTSQRAIGACEGGLVWCTSRVDTQIAALLLGVTLTLQ
jgi:hypothetical protein